jgi:hypothetical protein
MADDCAGRASPNRLRKLVTNFELFKLMNFRAAFG